MLSDLLGENGIEAPMVYSCEVASLMKLASMARGHANLRNQIRSIKTANGDEQNRERRSICAAKNLNGAMSEVGQSLAFAAPSKSAFAAPTCPDHHVTHVRVGGNRRNHRYLLVRPA
jgi:hypothetical protein